MSAQGTITAAEIERDQLPPTYKDHRLGAGGEGTVYKLGTTSFSSRPCAYKEYKPTVTINEQHLEKLVKFITKLGEVAPDRRDWLLDRAAWPTHIVRDQGKIVGIIMPLIPNRFFRVLGSSSTSTSERTAELQYLLNGAEYEQRIGLHVTEHQRYEFLEDFANLLRVLHGADIRVGDISVKNLLFCHDSPGSHVYLIDCDSMSIGNSEGPDVQTPNWNVPNGEKPQTKESDRYKFGLLTLRLLASDQATRDPNRLPAGTASLVNDFATRALTAVPSARPTPREWLAALAVGKDGASTQEVVATASSSIANSNGQTAQTDSADQTVASKTVARRTANSPTPKVVTTNTAAAPAAAASSAAPAATAPAAAASSATSTPATSGQTENVESKKKKHALGWPITWTLFALALCIYNFAIEATGAGVFMLIVFLVSLSWLITLDAENTKGSSS